MKSNGLGSLHGFSAAIAATILAAAAAMPGVALADDELSANVAVVSDYRFRGISQTFKRPALQGGADFAHGSGAYIGTWLSTVDKDFLTDTKGIEWDIYGGYKFPIGGTGITGDVGLLQYLYPGESLWNTTELYLGASWEWLSAKYSHSISKRTFGLLDSRGSGYLELNAAYPVPGLDGLSIVGHLGMSRFKNNGSADYEDYKFGVTYDWYGFTWGAAVVGASEDIPFSKPSGKTKELGKAGLVLSVSKVF
ncbi:MAG: TorF family putative porin [Lautropia sp.]